MKTLRRLSAIVATILLMVASASAQDVIITLQKKSMTLPSNLSSLIDNPQRIVRILLQNTTSEPQDIYLNMALTSDYAPNGTMLELHTEDHGLTRPKITLQPHEVRQFTSMDDFQSHFSGRLSTTATMGDVYGISRIPEGHYSFCFTVCRWHPEVVNDEVLSTQCIAYDVCYSASAPELTSPVMGATSGMSSQIDITRLTPRRTITFRWTPVITNCPGSLKCDYTLKIVKVNPNENPYHAIDHGPVVYSKHFYTQTTSHILDTLRDLTVQFQRGAVYAVQVQAVKARSAAASGFEIANKGKSQVVVFSWGYPNYNIDRNQTPTSSSSSSTSFSDNQADVLRDMRNPYIVLPFRDEENYQSVSSRFSDEKSKVPALDSSAIIRFQGTYNDHIVNTKTKKFNLKWMPLRGSAATAAVYTVSLYEDFGALADLSTQTPLATKNISPNTSDFTSHTPIEFSDSTWISHLQTGKKYIVELSTRATYHYYRYKVNETVHYVNGIEADTEYDTIREQKSETKTFTSSLRFQWGIDSTLLDFVTPPQFITPVNNATANCSDTSFLHLSTSIPSFRRFSWLSFKWNKPLNLDIEDQEALLYNVVIYSLPKGIDIDSCLHTEPLYKIDSLTSTELPKQWIDTLTTGTNYVARIKMLVPDTLKYNLCNGGWSHPIVFTLADTSEYHDAIDVNNACFASDTAGLSRELISPQVDSLINNRVKLKMGRFNLVVQEAKQSSNTYSGTGYVEWLPIAGYGCGIKVKFEDVKINKDYKIIAGSARSITTDSNNYLNLNLGNNKFGAGFDMYSDEAIAMLNQYAGELGSTGDEVKKWYNLINQYANPIASMTHSFIDGGGALGIITTPVRIPTDLLGSESENVSLAINDFYFSPVTAHYNLLAVYSSHEDNLYLPFLATNICIEPDALFSDSVGDINLFMAQNMDVPLSEGYNLTFKCPTKLSDLSDGTHLTFDKDGFKELVVDAEISFGTKDMPGNKVLAVDITQQGIVKADHPVKAYFYTKFRKWSDWVVKIGMDPFTVVGCEDYTFIPTGKGMWFDHSKRETPQGITFPEGYVTPDKRDAWQGFYLDQFAVMLPDDVSNTFSDLTNDESSTKFVTYTYGANGQLKDSSEVITPGTRINFSARNLILDEDGITLDVSANDLLHLNTEDADAHGWGFHLDTVGIRFLKSSFKEGYIIGRMRIPLFSGLLKYTCTLGTDSLDFAITPKDEIKLDLFAADINLEKNSTHFRIVHDYSHSTYVNNNPNSNNNDDYSTDNGSSTRVDLTLNGKINLNLRSFKIPMTLPGIKFENMYLRNYTSETRVFGSDTVTAYRFDGLEYSVGNWSKASPQKYMCGTDYTDRLYTPEPPAGDGEGTSEEKSIAKGNLGGFSYNLRKIDPFAEKKGNNVMKVGIKFDGGMSLGFGNDTENEQESSVGADVRFAIWCDVNTKTYKPSNFNGELDSVHLETNFGALRVDGMIVHDSNDTYGDYWKGMLDVKIMSVIKLKMGAGFGKVVYQTVTSNTYDGDGNQTSSETDKKTYSWWYLEGALELGAASFPLGPVDITGFGGAFAYNMVSTCNYAKMSAKQLRTKSTFSDQMVSSGGTHFKPSRDSWIARAGISLALARAEKAMNADGILNLRVVNGHFGGITLQVTAHVISKYNKTEKTSEQAAVDMAAFIDYTQGEKIDDWSLRFAAKATADFSLLGLLGLDNSHTRDSIARMFSYPTSSEEGGKLSEQDSNTTSLFAGIIADSREYAEEQQKADKLRSGEGVGANATLQVPVDLFIRHYPDGETGEVSGKDFEWYFSIGRPPHDDRVIFSANADLIVCKASTEWTFYLMMGNFFPDGYSLPDIPADVCEILGSKCEKFKNKFKTFTVPNAGGFAIGGSFNASLEVDMLIYLNLSATLGFDLALLDVNGAGCSSYSTIGKNDFYAMGQIYAALKGSLGFSLNLGFWKGRLILAESQIGALLAAGGPKPTWAYGALAFKAKCLGGLVKINTSIDFSLGNVCVPGNTDPLANAKLFQNVTPSYNGLDDARKAANMVSPYSVGTIVSNLPWNEDVLLTADEKYGEGTTSRTFRFIIDYSYVIQRHYSASEGYMHTGNPQLTFSRDEDEENVQYFQMEKGGFTGDRDYEVYLRGRAFEYRPSYNKYIGLSESQRRTDKYYVLGTNKVIRSYNNPTDTNEQKNWEYRDPVYTDREETTHRTWRQDTTFYFATQPQPKDLDNAVLFTWPYNGDPHVPVDEIFSVNETGRYALIYLMQDLDFLKKENLKNANYDIEAYLTLMGTNADNADAVQCTWTYESTGFPKGTKPCILIRLPNNFKQLADKYKQGDNVTVESARSNLMSIRLIKVNKKNKTKLMNQLQAQNDKMTAQMQVKTELTRSKSWSQSKENQMRQRQQSGDTNNIQYKMWKQSKTDMLEEEETMGDTAMAFDRKMAKNPYAIAMTCGVPIYTLYFGLDLDYNTYAEILSLPDWLDIFSAHEWPVVKNGNTYAGTISSTSKISPYLYLLAPYTPNDSRMYNTNVTLPPIAYPSIAWDIADQCAAPYTLRDIYSQRLIAMNTAMKNTTAPTQRPVYPPKPWENDLTKRYMPSEDEAADVRNGVFKNGFKRVTGNSWSNMDLRVKTGVDRDLEYYLRMSAYDQFPTTIKNENGRVITAGAPTLLKFNLNEKMYRVDSLTLNHIWANRPDVMRYTKYKLTDKAIATAIDDMQRYQKYYQELYDYAAYVYSKNHEQRIKQYQMVVTSPAYYQKAFTTASGLPYTTTRSTLMSWYMTFWKSWYTAIGARLNWKKPVEYTNFEWRRSPLSDDKLEFITYYNGSYAWMKYILHRNNVTQYYDDDQWVFYIGNLANNNLLRDEWISDNLPYKEPVGGLVSPNDWPSGQMPVRFYYVSGIGSLLPKATFFAKIPSSIGTTWSSDFKANKQVIVRKKDNTHFGYRWKLADPYSFFGISSMNQNIELYRKVSGIKWRTKADNENDNWETGSK